MKEPRKFPAVLTGTMIFLTGNHTILPPSLPKLIGGYPLVLFGGAGALAYMTFGSNIQTVVLVNLDSSSSMVQAVSPANASPKKALR